jgi:hypothetical protein
MNYYQASSSWIVKSFIGAMFTGTELMKLCTMMMKQAHELFQLLEPTLYKAMCAATNLINNDEAGS